MVKKNKLVNEFDRSVSTYFNEISKCTPLSREEEFNLWEQYKKNNDLNARDKLIISNLKFVARVACSYQGRGLSYADLIAEGNYGLLKAFEKFDHKKGYKTISYSVWWIRQAILDALERRNSIEAEDLPTENNKPEMYIESDEYVSDLEETETKVFYDEDYNDNQRKEEIKNIISLMTENLSNKEQNILNKYYGLNNTKTMTLEEIGKELGITKERVRQILVKIFKKLRAEALNLNILEYLCE